MKVGQEGGEGGHLTFNKILFLLINTQGHYKLLVYLMAILGQFWGY